MAQVPFVSIFCAHRESNARPSAGNRVRKVMSPIPIRTSRRSFLAGTTAGFALGVLALQARAQAAKEVALADYKPEYLSAPEYAFVMAATARLIPSDGDGPGAIETRVPVFIDRQLAGDFGTAADLYMEGPFSPAADPMLGTQTPLTPAEIYRDGIAAFDKWCSETQGGGFADLDADKQDAALNALSQDEVPLDPKLREFWTLLLQNTKEGYFSDPQYGGNAGMESWVYIGFPGARANFYEWVGRPEAYPLGPVDIAGERA
jgi:gluconate 2-dehydrogenase gamma chain